MKKILFALLLAVTAAACQKNGSAEGPDTSASKEAGSYIPPFEADVLPLSVDDLPVSSEEDTISYALGVAWSDGIGRLGLSAVSYAFYLGVHDYAVHNSSFIEPEKAPAGLEEQIGMFRNDSLPAMDADMKLRDIRLKSAFDTMSYVLGYLWCKGAKGYGIGKISPALMSGLTDGLKGDTSLFTYAKADQRLRAYVEEQRATAFSGVKAENERWLADNSSRAGVATLSGGVQYKVVREGTGKTPTMRNVVTCHYTGRLIDSTQFESSYEEGQPLRLYPAGYIKGWTDALLQMKEGSVWELYIPCELAFGSGGIKDKVPPFSTVIYRLELLRVE